MSQAQRDVARLLDLTNAFTPDDLVLDGASAEVRLGKALLDARVERSMESPTTLTLEIADDDWSLLGDDELLGQKRLRSDLKLEVADIVFVLSEVEKVNGGLSLVFYDRPTVLLQRHTRRMKAARDKQTRAQFFGTLCKAAGVTLYSIEKDVRQPIAGLDKVEAKGATKPTAQARHQREAKTPAADLPVTKRVSGPGSWFGRTGPDGAMDAGNPDKTTKSGKPDYTEGVAVNAFPGEGYDGAVRSWNAYHGGFWRVDAPNGRSAVFEHIDQGPNADGRVVDFTPRAVAALGYTTSSFPTSAGTFRLSYLGRGAAAAAAAGQTGGASPSASELRTGIETYEFTVEEGENYLAAGQRLADEVRWRCFSVGTGYVFDSDITLARADPSVTLEEGVDGVDTIRWLWTRRKRIDEVTVTLRAVPWLAPPGSVAKVVEEGPASGEYLVRSISSGLFGEDRSAAVTLGRPQKPRREPAPEGETLDSSSSVSSSGRIGRGGSVAPPLERIEEHSNGYSPGGHDGVDLICAADAPIYAICDAKVVDVRAGGWWGKNPTGNVAIGDGIVQLECLVDVGPFRKGMHFGYGHAEKATVRVGQTVRAGEQIGHAGFANAWHVHFMANAGTTISGIGDRDPYPYVAYAIAHGR